jgi:hypothetical protein
MTVESTEVPAERVAPVAEEMSSNAKTYAGALGFVAFLVAVIVIAESQDDLSAGRLGTSSDIVATLVVGGLFMFIPIHFAIRYAGSASRATRAARLAKTDDSYTWRLSGNCVSAADGAGVTRPDVTFKINLKLRAKLLGVPRASVVDRS